MEEDFEMDRERIYRMRRMARKLAHNKSKDRVVRKLPQAMIIVRAATPKRVIPVRKVINGNKRMTYMVLLGAALCAYFYDVDQDTLELMFRTVENVLGNT